ncbi:MAG: DNA polymerase/3'-5' exonuclease PolX [Chthoniobacterales bacterium]|nr:DNA polymerase/3'-5' exonuclease PolX [Chthoniobacterales bacterium]
MKKEQVVEILETIATLLELQAEENPFKIRAYTNAARSLETWGGDLRTLAEENRLTEIPGVGKAIAGKIGELVLTGSSKFYDELRAQFPQDIMELFSLPGLGAKKIKALYEKLQVNSVGDLAQACAAGRVAELPGFGKATQEKLAKTIADRAKHVGSFQLGAVANEAEQLQNDLGQHPEVLRVSVAGSYRRRKEIVRDLDFIVATKNPKSVTESFVRHPLVDGVIARGTTKTSVRLHSGIQADLRVVSGAEYPFALSYFTGSKEHNIVLRNRALQRGWTLNEYRLAPVETGKKAPEKIPPVREEAELYRALGLDFVPPELRENSGEIEAAAEGRLPRLLEPENLRGVFHCHTSASDGRNSLEEMAAAAQELGLQYLGIADHSRSSIQAGGLAADRLRAQVSAIRKLNKSFDGFRLFAGVECDILRDGSLDFDDETLGELDYVVASIHSSFQLPEAEMTERIIRAIANPHVTFLAHPTGRLLLKRDAYAVDIPAVIEAAAATGTWLEINAAPKRLDLDWRWWPLAKEKGVKCVINPDAHGVEKLQELWFGVGVARKGWLTKSDVVNCLPLGKIEPELQRKRALSSRA